MQFTNPVIPGFYPDTSIAGTIVLKVEAHPERFTFFIQQGQSEAIEVGSGETHLLLTEVAGGFTGVIVAMYSVCETGQSTPAYFDWFDYEPVEPDNQAV